MSDAPWFWRAFTPDTSMPDEQYGSITLSQRVIGNVKLPSGRLVVCDVLTDPDARPLSIGLPPGSYPVEVAIASLGDGDERIAAARICLRSSDPTTWMFALRQGQDAETVSEDDLLFGVDSGTAAFLSAEAAVEVSELLDETFDDQVTEAMDAVYRPTRKWAEIPLSNGELNMVICSTGFGDGSYPIFLGVDASGEPVAVVADFGVVLIDSDLLGP